jgi:hypothetical protein
MMFLLCSGTGLSFGWRPALVWPLANLLATRTRLEVAFSDNVLGHLLGGYAEDRLTLRTALLGVQLGAHIFGQVRRSGRKIGPTWFGAAHRRSSRG